MLVRRVKTTVLCCSSNLLTSENFYSEQPSNGRKSDWNLLLLSSSQLLLYSSRSRGNILMYTGLASTERFWTVSIPREKMKIHQDFISTLGWLDYSSAAAICFLWIKTWRHSDRWKLEEKLHLSHATFPIYTLWGQLVVHGDNWSYFQTTRQKIRVSFFWVVDWLAADVDASWY